MAAPLHKPLVLSRRSALAICAILILLHVVLSLCAVRGKSATSDEPLHLMAGLSHLRLLDFRADYEAPPLWKYWAALPHAIHPPELREDDPAWAAMLDVLGAQWQWSVVSVYRTSANDADRLLWHSRIVMSLLSVGVAALLCVWSWKLGGPLAGVIGCALYCLDPNFLAHGPLVKNDVVFAGTMALFGYLVWVIGRRATVLRAVLLGLTIGAALCIKFTALLFPLLLLILLVVRALLPAPWHVRSRLLKTTVKKIFAAAAILAVAGMLAYATVWAVYAFRFAPTPDPNSRLPLKAIGTFVAGNELFAARDAAAGHPDPRPLSDTEKLAWRPGILMRCVLFGQEHQLLPDAWLSGLLYTQGSALLRQSFLLGQRRDIGWWYYFPLAFLFKTPTATLVSLALTGGLAVRRIARIRHWRIQRASRFLWVVSSLGVPLLAYIGMILRSNLNLGLRHAFPVHLFLYIAAAATASIALRNSRGRALPATCALLLVALAVETILAFPNFIPFFNTPSALAFRDGLDALSDSNLDWGQDLPALAAWRKAHPDGALYLNYFGTADPAYYGLQYTNLPADAVGQTPAYQWGPPPQWPSESGYLAISATRLQFAHANGAPSLYRDLWKQKPIAVLGKSIYIYAFPPR